MSINKMKFSYLFVVIGGMLMLAKSCDLHGSSCNCHLKKKKIIICDKAKPAPVAPPLVQAAPEPPKQICQQVQSQPQVISLVIPSISASTSTCGYNVGGQNAIQIDQGNIGNIIAKQQNSQQNLDNQQNNNNQNIAVTSTPSAFLPETIDNSQQTQVENNTQQQTQEVINNNQQQEQSIQIESSKQDKGMQCREVIVTEKKKHKKRHHKKHAKKEDDEHEIITTTTTTRQKAKAKKHKKHKKVKRCHDDCHDDCHCD
jgi:hypothetical protein